MALMKSRVLESGISYMTQPYHINGQKGYNYDHWGVDLVDWDGSHTMLGWIVAHSDGKVVAMRNDCAGYEPNSYGNYVLIRHPNNMHTIYAHLYTGTVQVNVGQQVKKGQRLGYMGNTGTSNGGHLHFEIRETNGYQIDPEPYLNKDLPNMTTKKWVQKPVWYLYEGDKMLTGWQEVKSKWYYLDDNGVMHTGWLYDKSYKGWFLFSNNGDMLTGWQKVKDKWYYLAPATTNSTVKGKMVTGWLKDNGKWYYLDPSNGHMYADGTFVIEGKKYTFDKSGALVE